MPFMERLRAGIETLDAIEREWARRIGVRRATGLRAALEVTALSEGAD